MIEKSIASKIEALLIFLVIPHIADLHSNSFFTPVGDVKLFITESTSRTSSERNAMQSSVVNDGWPSLGLTRLCVLPVTWGSPEWPSQRSVRV